MQILFHYSPVQIYWELFPQTEYNTNQKETSQMLSSEQNVQVSDTTDDDKNYKSW